MEGGQKGGFWGLRGVAGVRIKTRVLMCFANRVVFARVFTRFAACMAAFVRVLRATAAMRAANHMKTRAEQQKQQPKTPNQPIKPKIKTPQTTA